MSSKKNKSAASHTLMFYGNCTERKKKGLGLSKQRNGKPPKQNKSEKSNIETGEEKNMIY